MSLQKEHTLQNSHVSSAWPIFHEGTWPTCGGMALQDRSIFQAMHVRASPLRALNSPISRQHSSVPSMKEIQGSLEIWCRLESAYLRWWTDECGRTVSQATWSQSSPETFKGSQVLLQHDLEVPNTVTHSRGSAIYTLGWPGLVSTGSSDSCLVLSSLSSSTFSWGWLWFILSTVCILMAPYASYSVWF